jgi:hypothetical protein
MTAHDPFENRSLRIYAVTAVVMARGIARGFVYLAGRALFSVPGDEPQCPASCPEMLDYLSLEMRLGKELRQASGPTLGKIEP